MKLITYYIVHFDVIGDIVAVAICLAIERSCPGSACRSSWLFFLSLWAAWVIAVKMTEPKMHPHRLSVQRATSEPKPPSLSGSLDGGGSRREPASPAASPA